MQSSQVDYLYDPTDSKIISSSISGLDKAARDAIKHVQRKGLIVAYSGGIDSAILAELLYQTFGSNHSALLSLGSRGSRDIRDLGIVGSTNSAITHIVKAVENECIENAASKVQGILQVGNLSHFEDCVAFYLIAEEASKMENAEVVVSANGPDELFCGYDRFRRLLDSEGYEAVILEISRALEIARELQKKVKTVLREFSMESAEPFLSNEFVKFALDIPVRLKIAKGDDRIRKRIWREYGRNLGLPNSVVMKEKKAMQYSMGIHKVVLSMLRRNKLKLRRD